MERSIGIYEYERSTANTHRYARVEGGRKETQYVAKSVFRGADPPDRIEVVLRWGVSES